MPLVLLAFGVNWFLFIYVSGFNIDCVLCSDIGGWCNPFFLLCTHCTCYILYQWWWWKLKVYSHASGSDVCFKLNAHTHNVNKLMLAAVFSVFIIHTAEADGRMSLVLVLSFFKIIIQIIGQINLMIVLIKSQEITKVIFNLEGMWCVYQFTNSSWDNSPTDLNEKSEGSPNSRWFILLELWTSVQKFRQFIK